MSFNLIDEPFIPCLSPDGSKRELGLLGVFEEAPHLAEIRDESPLVTVSLHRLLLAILHRVFGPKDLDAWKALWDAGRFDISAIDEYLEEQRAAFDLFDKRRPFYQDASLTVKRPSPISRLAKELASGNNATLFDHTSESRGLGLSSAASARLLVAEQSIAVGGGKSERGYTTHSPLIGGVSLLAMGTNVFETLVLNLVCYDQERPFPSGDDAAPWEPNRFATDEIPAGYVDLLTWQSRAMRLLGDGISVGFVAYAQGRRFQPTQGFFEPSMSYRRDAKGDRSIRLSSDRALWRDSAALFRAARTNDFKCAAVLEHLAAVESMGLIPRQFNFELAAFGICNDQARIDLWRHERFPLPAAYLLDPGLVDDLADILRQAEDVGRAVRTAGWNTAKQTIRSGQNDPDRDRVEHLYNSLAPDRRYWSRLEIPFRQALVDLPGDEDHRRSQRRRWFETVLRPVALKSFGETFGQCDRSARQLKAMVQGERFLNGELAKLRRSLPEATVSEKEVAR